MAQQDDAKAGGPLQRVDRLTTPPDEWQRYFLRELIAGRSRMDAMQNAINENADNVRHIQAEMSTNTATTLATKKDTEELISLWRDVKGTVRMATAARNFGAWVGGVALGLAGLWVTIKTFFR